MNGLLFRYEGRRTFFGLVTLLAAPLFAATPSADFSFLTTALVRADNDLDYFDHKAGKSVPLPPKVRQAIQTLAKENFKEAYQNADPRYPPTPKDVIHTIFKIRGPGSLELYVPYFERFPMGGDVYYFFLYDTKNQTLTREPAAVSSRWLGEGDNPADFPLEKPYVSFLDLYRNGSPAMVVQEFYHNGTMSDAALYHYDSIGKDMSLTEVLTVHSRFQRHYFKEKIPDENSVPHDLDISRAVKPLGNNQVEVTTTVSMDDEAPVTAGSAVLTCNKPGQPFQKGRITVADKRFGDYARNMIWNWKDEDDQ